MNFFFRQVLSNLTRDTIKREEEKLPSHCEFCGAAVVNFGLHYAFHAKVDALVRERTSKTR